MDTLSEFDIALPDQVNSAPEQGLHVIQTKLACLEVRVPLGVPQADGLLRARHDIADEDIQGRVCSIRVPACSARAPVGSPDEVLAQGGALALADERTWRLPASGWAVFH